MGATYETEEAMVHPEVRVILEKGDRNWSAYIPSVPGCVATGADRDSVIRNLTEALTFHLDGLHEDAIRDEAAAEGESITVG